MAAAVRGGRFMADRPVTIQGIAESAGPRLALGIGPGGRAGVPAILASNGLAKSAGSAVLKGIGAGTGVGAFVVMAMAQAATAAMGISLNRGSQGHRPSAQK